MATTLRVCVKFVSDLSAKKYSTMYILILSFLTAFALTYLAIPSIIKIARSKHLFDEPSERSSHTENTPSLGGIGIFAGAIFSIVLWTPFGDFSELQYILCAFIIIFLIGAKDDIDPMSPYKKLAAQLLAAFILVFKAEIAFSSLYGLAGFHEELPIWLSATFSSLTILLITNAFNLVDGINGLAGSIGTLIVTTLGLWFFMTGDIELAIVAFATAGAVIAFLRYNFTPAQIFMGDTGSLMIGLVCAILAIKFLEINHRLENASLYKFQAGPAVIVGIIILPLYDTLRVFFTRLLRGASPFRPDRRHIHHLLIDYGMSHMRATAVLTGANALFISFVFIMHTRIGMHTLLLILLTVASLLTYGLHRSVLRKKEPSAV